MEARLIEQIETGTGRGAAALFAGAVGYAVYAVLATAGMGTPIGLCAAGAGALAYLPCSHLLAGRRSGAFALPNFIPPQFDFSDAPEDPEELLLTERLQPVGELLLTDCLAAGELLLTDADRLDVPLILDDVLAALGPQSRVVRLFDGKAMAAPTPGQLQSRIARHLDDGAARSAPSDASQALSDALAELRRSLR